jgi:hypothetical protein
MLIRVAMMMTFLFLIPLTVFASDSSVNSDSAVKAGQTVPQRRHRSARRFRKRTPNASPSSSRSKVGQGNSPAIPQPAIPDEANPNQSPAKKPAPPMPAPHLPPLLP